LELALETAKVSLFAADSTTAAEMVRPLTVIRSARGRRGTAVRRFSAQPN
jgi:hypothetical protein